MQQEYNFRAFQATNDEELNTLEAQHRRRHDANSYEAMPWAMNARFTEIAREVVPDKDGEWAHPIVCLISEHSSTTGIKNVCMKAVEFFGYEKEENPLDLLSVSAGMENGRLTLKTLIRCYGNFPDMQEFFRYFGEDITKKEEVPEEIKGKLIIPDEIKEFQYTEEEIRDHKNQYAEQQKIFEKASKEKPFLNQLEKYTPKRLPNPEDSAELTYDLKTKDMRVRTVTAYETFIEVFNDIMVHVSGVEKYHYANVMAGEESEESFLRFIESHITTTYIENGKQLAIEDLPIMMDKVNTALFKMYIIQDLIDDPDITDIKITAPDAIRVRIKGKAYLSNIHFVDLNDYLRFLDGICLRNGIPQNAPEVTFTDTTDENYIQRFSLMEEYVNSVDWPYLHIRKIAKNKLMAPDLIRLGMFDEKVRDYLLDCGRNSRGVVFAGPPGSGKTICLNWFLEDAYEQSAEILVIQENDELFAYRKGVMFQHVVNFPQKNKPAVSLEQLGQLALVAGANVFIIGEAKGAEICSAITLSNSGCRTAITIHSSSSTEIPEKMADLAMRGYATDYKQAKRMLKSFQTLVYLEDFQVKEISEIAGFNEETGEIEYRYIYRKEVA